MSTYAEKLKDPRWQRKRLEVMQRDRFTCRSCGHQDKTLNVHHAVYRPRTNPWEYPDSELETLCGDCHKARHEIMERASALIQRWEAAGDIVRALERIVDRWQTEDPADGDEWATYPRFAISAWAWCAKYPDLIAEAERRTTTELEARAAMKEGA